MLKEQQNELASRRQDEGGRQGKMEGRTERTQGIVTIINMQQSIKERTVLAKEQQLQAHRKDLVERCVGQVRDGGR